MSSIQHGPGPRRPNHNSRKHSQGKFLAGLLFLVASLGLSAFLDLMRPPRAVTAKSQNQAQFNGLDSRKPSSLPSTDVLKAGDRPSPLSGAKNEILKWNCTKTPVQLKVAVDHVRISGQACSDWVGENFEIYNESNGVTGNLFSAGREFTTDFLKLKIGLNRIHIKNIDSSSEQIIEVIFAK